MTGIDPSTMVGVGKLQQLLHANPDLWPTLAIMIDDLAELGTAVQPHDSGSGQECRACSHDVPGDDWLHPANHYLSCPAQAARALIGRLAP